jgi:ABC-type transport system substrate-binding protein
MNRTRRVALVVSLCTVLVGGIADPAAPQPRPEGEMRWALYVTLAPAWFDPGEVAGVLTPFWVLYALHDALVKPMPGNQLSPSLAESWTVSADQKAYEFNAVYGNAASRMSETVPSDGIFTYGSYPDIDALYKQQARETDRKKREVQLRQIQQLLYERVRFAPIFDYVWASAIGPRVEEPALMLIDPYPWSAPLEEVRLKRK